MKTIFIGDVHGCLEELKELLTLVQPSSDDRLAFVGDLVDRGPDSIGVIRYVKNLICKHPGSFCVAGNHESKVLRQKDRGQFRQEWTNNASEEDWLFLDSLPLFKKLPELNTTAVHAGFYPRFFQYYPEGIGACEEKWRTLRDKKVDRARRFLFVRYVNPKGHPVSLGDETSDDVFWTERYLGQEGYVFYGHQPYLNPPAPKLTDYTCGLDTACVFGGRLTAAVVENDSRKAEFISVKAKEVYASPRLQF